MYNLSKIPVLPGRRAFAESIDQLQQSKKSLPVGVVLASAMEATKVNAATEYILNE